MSLQGKKAVVLIEEQYQELEVWVPYFRLKEEGAGVLLMGQEKGRVFRGKFGYPATAETDYKETRPDGVDLVVIPGGFAPDFMRRYPEPARFVAGVFAADKVVASICHGAWLLSSAGVLKGRRATAFHAIADDVRNAGAQWVDAEVCVDGRLITSRKPEDLPAFCREILKALAAA
ncbi:MAG: type 1 glutamine amidotransferase [Elusimicrobia bacterium]|nr:type 1 glutamine amidotransferase [Elusimicrobiota bacterium]